MMDPDNILLDNGAIIEYLGNIVSRSADQLYPTLKGLVIRLRAHKCRQARVVNADQVLRADRANELVRKYLHVTRENNQSALVFPHQRDCFCSASCLFSFV